jgi:hypothetical protein
MDMLWPGQKKRVFCGRVIVQLLTVLAPLAGCIAVKKVRFDGNTEYQYIENFKLLQGSFNKKSVDKVSARAVCMYGVRVLTDARSAGRSDRKAGQGTLPGQL